ncbi:MAG: hypothetical protein IKW88_01055 [Clostridiales bacterium]|nr:hypothetical protein [Clostridiales bacterium]
MGRNKKKKQSRNSLSNGKKLIIILLLSCSLVAFGICAALSFNNVAALTFVVPTGILAFVLFFVLLKDYKIEKKGKRTKEAKTAKWYIDKFLAGLVPVLVIAALVMIVSYSEEDHAELYVAGFLMFPVLSIAISPNAALYSLKDMKNWKQIFYGKGNLENFKDNNDFYKVKAPLPYERRIYRAVVKDQFLNVATVLVIMILISVIAILKMMRGVPGGVTPGHLIEAIIYVRAKRAMGFRFFTLLLIAVFGFPIFVWYVTNAISKLRIISKHEYIAYHAVVESVNGYVMRINSDGREYRYDYCTLIGMKAKQVKNTPATLVFIPDDVLMFPDEVFEK